MTPVQRERFKVFAASVSSLIKQAREQTGLSQHALAVKIGVSQSYLSMLEKGTKTPSLETLFVLSDLMMMHVEVTFTE